MDIDFPLEGVGGRSRGSTNSLYLQYGEKYVYYSKYPFFHVIIKIWKTIKYRTIIKIKKLTNA